jgi:hypothetical protein
VKDDLSRTPDSDVVAALQRCKRAPSRFHVRLSSLELKISNSPKSTSSHINLFSVTLHHLLIKTITMVSFPYLSVPCRATNIIVPPSQTTSHPYQEFQSTSTNPLTGNENRTPLQPLDHPLSPPGHLRRRALRSRHPRHPPRRRWSHHIHLNFFSPRQFAPSRKPTQEMGGDARCFEDGRLETNFWDRGAD